MAQANPLGQGWVFGMRFWPGGGDFCQKILPWGRGGAIFTLKICNFFSKNRLFYEKFVPWGGEFGKNLDPGMGDLTEIFGSGVPNPHPCRGGR